MNALLALLLASAARADPAVDGSSGLLTLPIPDTVESGSIGAAMGMTTAVTTTGTRFAGMPLGVSAGLTSQSEVGIRLERTTWSEGEEAGNLSAGFGFHGRYRLVDPALRRFGLGLHGAMRSVQHDSAGELLVLAQHSLQESDLYLAFGPRLRFEHGMDLLTGLGFRFRVAPRADVMSEGSLSVGTGGYRGLGYRGGARIWFLDGVAAMPWVGAGTYDERPWLGGGVSLALASRDPTDADRDGDGVVDAEDRCPHDAEDEDGFDDEDGCVDRDNDGDGIPDELDDTPDGVEVLKPDAFEHPTPRFRLRRPEPKLPGPTQPDPRREGPREDDDASD